MLERAAVIAVAFLLDMIIGDPHFLWHPIRAIGWLIEHTEKLLRFVLKINPEREANKTKKRVAGVMLVLIVVSISATVPALILFGASKINHYFALGIEAVMCYQLLAMKSLKVESMKVYKALKHKTLEDARYAVSMIVGRDTASLNEEGVTKAAVETVAENTSDGVIAPMIYMLIFGVVGGYIYKAINTMDSMVAYKNDKYIYFGTAAAKLDDVVNFIPARIAALIMILSAGLLPGMSLKNSWKIYKRDRYKHASPNSAQTEAACAGALGVMLAGNAYYFGKLYEKPTIGDANRSIEIEDIKRANKLLYMTSFITLLMGLSVLMICFALI